MPDDIHEIFGYDDEIAFRQVSTMKADTPYRENAVVPTYREAGKFHQFLHDCREWWGFTLAFVVFGLGAACLVTWIASYEWAYGRAYGEARGKIDSECIDTISAIPESGEARCSPGAIMRDIDYNRNRFHCFCEPKR